MGVSNGSERASVVEQLQAPPDAADGASASGELAKAFGAGSDRTFEQSATMVLSALQMALSDLLRAAPEPTRTASEVERALGVDYKLSWQVHRIATVRNPLAGGANVPARVSMQKLLNAAARRRIPTSIISRVSEAFDAFERLIESEAGDRGELEAMLAAFVPETREKRELEIKRAAFKAMSQVKSVTMDAQVGAFLLHPSADGKAVDRATFSAYVGLRRLRPGAYIGFTTVSATTPGSTVQTLDGTAPDGGHSILLPQFCSKPTPRFEVNRYGPHTRYSLVGSDIGVSAAVQLVMAELRRGAMRRYRQPDGTRMSGVMNTTDIPMKRQTTDIFIHRDVYPGSQPEFGVFDTVPRGLATALDDPAREIDRIPFEESVRPLAGGLEHAGLAHLPGYTDMLGYVCERLGWERAAFRGYRLDVLYPVYGAQYMIGFAVPAMPLEG